jgi:hypothetical protein
VSELLEYGRKGSIGHAFTVCIYTENQNQVSFYPFVLHAIFVLIDSSPVFVTIETLAMQLCNMYSSFRFIIK